MRAAQPARAGRQRRKRDAKTADAMEKSRLKEEAKPPEARRCARAPSRRGASRKPSRARRRAKKPA